MNPLSQFLKPVAILNATAGSPSVRETPDLAFGPGARDRVDLYAPVADGPHPVVVFCYGGAWEDGDRADYRFVGTALASRCFVVAIPDYRVYPEVRFPGFVTDVARAVRWVRDNAAGYGGDGGRLVLAGHSAGAHIAAMLALDPQFLAMVGMAQRDVSGLLGLAGPYDFLPLRSERLKTIFGPEAGRKASQPIEFASGTAPPALLITGERDNVVGPGNSERLAERLRARGASARALVYPRVGHAELVGAFAAPLRWLAPVLRDSAAFIAETTR